MPIIYDGYHGVRVLPGDAGSSDPRFRMYPSYWEEREAKMGYTYDVDDVKVRAWATRTLPPTTYHEDEYDYGDTDDTVYCPDCGEPVCEDCGGCHFCDADDEDDYSEDSDAY